LILHAWPATPRNFFHQTGGPWEDENKYTVDQKLRRELLVGTDAAAGVEIPR